MGTARLSPSNRKIANLDKRIRLLEKYEREFRPRKIDLETYVSPDKWRNYWENRANLIRYMRESNNLAAEIQKEIKEKIEKEI